MPEITAWMKLVLAALATWRITHLFAYEDGPWNVIARLRRLAGQGFWGQLLDCFYCLSVWAAAAITALLFPVRKDWLLVWLALSGAACLLDRIGRDPVVVQPIDQLNTGGIENALLRSESGESPKYPGNAGSGQQQ